MSHLASGEPGEYEAADSTLRWRISLVSISWGPLRDKLGNILKWYGTNTDIHDSQARRRCLRRARLIWRKAQRLSHTGSWLGMFLPNGFSGPERLAFLPRPTTTTPTMEIFLQRYIGDRAFVVDAETELSRGRCGIRYRIVLPDNSIKYVRIVPREQRLGPGG